MNVLNFFQQHEDELVRQFGTHLELMGWSLGLALLVAAPLSVAMLRYQAMASPILASTAIVQTIPSIALLGFLLPWLGIGSKTAVVALVLYALLPLIRNGYVGFSGIDPLVIDAARGMGMYWHQILWQLRVPLALPVIFAGIRTAAVINVGVTTLSALVGAGGLGVFIFRGIATNNTAVILLGAFPAALLAVTIDSLLAWVQNRLVRHRGRTVLGMTVGLVLLVATLVSFSRLGGSDVPTEPVWQGGFTSEFLERPDGFHSLVKAYGLRVQPRELDTSLLYDAVRDNQVNLACGFSTDGRISAYHLRMLEDDRHFFPDYSAGLLVREAAWQAHPELAGALGSLSGAIDAPSMQRMNYLVDKEGRDPRSVADDFLADLAHRRGMIFDRRQVASKGNGNEKADIVIGSKDFTEQYIMGYLLADWINGTSPLRAQLREGLGGSGICFDALCRGDIDAYPEYSGTALLSLLKVDPVRQGDVLRDPPRAENFLKEQMAGRYGLRWSVPLGFNNTYTILMPESRAQLLGISKISDLTDHHP